MLKYNFNQRNDKVYHNPIKNDQIELAIKKRVFNILESYCSEDCRILSASFHYSLYYPIIVDVLISSNRTRDHHENQLKRKICLPNFPNVNIELHITFLTR